VKKRMAAALAALMLAAGLLSGCEDVISVDVDLTKMNSTMVYSEVSNMVSKPDDYRGRVVKMKGAFAVYPGTERNYYACIISDATACCQQGLEFVLKGNHDYPEDYPAEGTEIVVTGRFETYMEGTSMYFQLSDATMEKK